MECICALVFLKPKHVIDESRPFWSSAIPSIIRTWSNFLASTRVSSVAGSNACSFYRNRDLGPRTSHFSSNVTSSCAKKESNQIEVPLEPTVARYSIPRTNIWCYYSLFLLSEYMVKFLNQLIFPSKKSPRT